MVRWSVHSCCPAGDGAVGSYTNGHGPDTALNAPDVVAPAGDGAVGSEPTRMGTACRHRAERPRWCLFTPVVAPPAGDGAVGSEPTRIEVPADTALNVPDGALVRPIVTVVAPAGDGAVGSEPTRMTGACRHRAECSGWCTGPSETGCRPSR